MIYHDNTRGKPMYRQKVTEQQFKEAMENHPGVSHAELGRILGVDESTIRYRKNKLAKQGWSPDHDMTKETPEGYKIKGVSSYYVNGRLAAQWVKTSEDRERQLELVQQAIEGFVKDLPKITPTTIYNEHQINENLMAVYPLGDPHIGMLSWEKETGENWDLAIAEDTFVNVFDRVVKCAPQCKEGVVVNLGDFFHYDNMEGITSRSGHNLDRDGRYAKMVQVGVKILRRMITTALEHHETVRIINVIGNHDDTGAIFLSVCLKHVYENEPRVIVDDAPSPFHYVRFGKVLLGAHHGHTCKMEKLPGVMAADRSVDWGQTEFRYWLTGHIHHDSKKEYPGVMVESFRTLAAKDSYAMYSGWRSGRDTKVIVYHKEFGEVERHTVCIQQVQ